MAAALFRRGTGLCCVHRELCRVTWRPQAAEFCSRPTDRRPPPRIKKAKTQPAVDVAELLQQRFPRGGPGTAPPVVWPAEASPVKASSSSSELPPLSKTAVSFSRGASAFKRVDARGLYNVTSGSSLTSAAPSAPLASLGSEPRPAEPAARLPAADQVVVKAAETSSRPAALREPPTEIIDVEHTLSPAVGPEAEAQAEQVLIAVDLSHAAEEEPSVEATAEPAREAGASQVSEGPAGESAPSDSVHEAAGAIKAEAAVVTEAVLGLERGPTKAGQEPAEQQGGASEAAGLGSVTSADAEALEDETPSETAHCLERDAGHVPGDKTAEDVAEEVMPSEETTEALSLAAHLQMGEMLFSVPAPVTGVTGGPVGRETARAETLDATVASGSVDTAAVTDDPPALQEVLLQGEEEEAEALGNEDGKGTNADLDPVQRLFLEKIKEYQNIHRLNGGQLEAEPDYKKHLSEETAKLRRLYGGGGGGGGGDLSSFPEFTFTEPQLDQDSK
ncbi:uncharacterized protein LOC119214345 [Pungitius pungitius]|uniref:uncharacterized protein LOC119214345 n=1 Tax=Pungitius pungitius TaxID=134920 RepID=UPI002E0F50A7